MLGRLRTIAILAALAIAAAGAGLASLPPLDRDEARFAQATVQMIESGDYVRISFQDDARNKKPAGIHWLQAGAVQVISSAQARAIWAFRLPSVLGLVIAVIATYGAGCILFGRRAAFASAGLLAVGALAAAEGGIAKTDAMLMAATAVTMASLVALYAGMRREYGLLFWGALAAGVLIKGPVTPVVAGLAILTLVVTERRMAWLKPLLWWPGLLLAVALIAPWFVAVQQFTDGGFLREAFAGDVGPKLISGHEGHGAPPLTHTGLAPFLFWPGTLFLLPGLALAYRAYLHPFPRPEVLLHVLYAAAVMIYLTVWGYATLYGGDLGLTATPALYAIALFPVFTIALKLYFKPTDDGPMLAMRFLGAWAAPAWAALELLPTKLPHYPLPLYPALALMAGAAFIALVERRIPVAPKIASALVFALVGGVFTAALILMPAFVNSGVALDPSFENLIALVEGMPPLTLLMPLIVAGGLFAAPIVMWRAPRVVLWLTLAAGLTFQWSLRHVVAPSIEPLWVSARISEELEAYALHPRLSPYPKPPLVSAGYNEPSLVFLTSTDLVLADGAEAARFAGEEAGRATLVEAAERQAFLDELEAIGATAEPLVDVRGINYSRGEFVQVTIYRTTQRARRPATENVASQ